MAEEGAQRRLAAIMSTDMVGYSRLMEADEAGTIARQKAHREHLIDPAIADHGGRIVKTTGDGLLIEFVSVVDAVACAARVQRAMAAREADVPEERRIQYRVGINLGDIVIDGDDILGDGVNVAARLQEIAEPGGVCISGTAYDAAKTAAEAGFEFLGEQQVKNISEPIRTYRVLWDAPAGTTKTRPARRSMPLMAAVGVLLLVIGGVAIWKGGQAPPPAPPAATEAQAPLPLPDKPSIAVLPFDNLSGDPEQEYFADGMADDVITDLSKISGLFVIARNSSFSYKGKATDVRTVARDLNVRYVLEGSVRRVGDQVRINAQLIDATTGGHLWAERYDGRMTDIFALQDKVTAKIVDALRVVLTPDEKARLRKRPTDNLLAYDFYLKARAAGETFREEGIRTALSHFTQATTLDPAFAEAYLGEAWFAFRVWRYGYFRVMPGSLALVRARSTSKKALALDPNLPGVYSLLASIKLADGQYEEAINNSTKAVQLGSGESLVHARHAWILAVSGRAIEAKASIETAHLLNPKPDVLDFLTMGWTRHFLGQHDKAIANLLQLANPDLDVNPAWYEDGLASSYAQIGKMEDAKAAVARLLKVNPRACLANYRMQRANFKRPEDLERHLNGLRLAGLPEWPRGFEGREEDRLNESELKALISPGTLTWTSFGGTKFREEIGSGGQWAFGPLDGSWRLEGETWADGNAWCRRSPSLFVGRPYCFPVYRNPGGSPEEMNDYVFATPFDAYYLSRLD